MIFFGLHINNYIALIVAVIVSIGILIWAYINDYLSWEQVKETFGIEGMKDMMATMVQQPKFIFIYIIFVFMPLWIFTDGLHFYTIPLYQKIILSLGGIFGVNYIIKVRGVE